VFSLTDSGMTLNIPMNFITYQHQDISELSMQYDGSISGSSDCCSSSDGSTSRCSDRSKYLEPTPIFTQAQQLQLDGKNFYPVSDDVLSPIDLSCIWEDRPTEIEESMLASLLPMQSRVVADNHTTMFQGASITHVTDGETSDNSSVSTGVFENATRFDLEPNPFLFPPNLIMCSLQGQQVNTIVPTTQQQPVQSQFMDVSPLLSAMANQSNYQAHNHVASDEDDDVSLSAIVSGQDRRFKPFHEEKWNQRYEELIAFHRKHGHAAVPHTYPPNQQLARWIKR
jgi:Helicase associated domain